MRTYMGDIGKDIVWRELRVEARDSLGRFTHPDDLVTLAGLDQHRYDEIRELVILL